MILKRGTSSWKNVLNIQESTLTRAKPGLGKEHGSLRDAEVKAVSMDPGADM